MPSIRVVRRTRHKLRVPAVGSRNVKVGVINSEVDKAIWNHFGTAGGASGGGWGGPIPPRPWMALSMRENRGAYRTAMRAGAKALMMGTASTNVILAKLGALAQGDMQQTLTALDSPSNADVTIARKGSSNPLIDTGALRQAHTWELF